MSVTEIEHKIEKEVIEVDNVTIRFAGDSGDGMQLTGMQFTNTSAVLGNDISTLPDFPVDFRSISAVVIYELQAINPICWWQ